MAEVEAGSRTAGSPVSGGVVEPSLKDKVNEYFKTGDYLKVAALYTQAIKQGPNNSSLYRFLFFLMQKV